MAAKLGIHPSAVTQFLCFTNDPPPFLLRLYYAGRCRSPQYLYRLTRLWKADTRRVEEACAAAGEVGLQLTEALESTLHAGGTSADMHGEPASAPAPPIGEAPSPPSPPAGQGQRAGRSSNAAASPHPSVGSVHAARLRKPRLFGRAHDRDIELLLSIRPSSADKLVVRYANEMIESEIDLASIMLTRLDGVTVEEGRHANGRPRLLARA